MLGWLKRLFHRRDDAIAFLHDPRITLVGVTWQVPDIHVDTPSAEQVSRWLKEYAEMRATAALKEE